MALVDEIRDSIKEAYITNPQLQQAYGFDASKYFDAQFSPTSVEAIDINIIAEVLAAFRTIVQADKANIENTVANNHLGTEPWYVSLAKQFQWSENENYQLIVDELSGKISYDVINPNDRIVTQASCITATTAEGTRVIVKVATGEKGKLKPLTESQLFDLKNYMRSLKIAGITIDVISELADIVELQADVYCDPSFNANLLKEAVTASLDRYSVELPYNGIIYKSEVLNAVKRVDGVLDVVIPGNGLIGKHGEVATPIERAYTTYSGYFNFKKEDGYPILNIIPND